MEETNAAETDLERLPTSDEHAFIGESFEIVLGLLTPTFYTVLVAKALAEGATGQCKINYMTWPVEKKTS